MRVIGLISGTSMDGVDAAIVTIETGGLHDKAVLKLEAFKTTPYPPGVRAALAAIVARDGDARPPHAVVRDVCALNFAIGEVFASAALALADENLGTVDLIGSHGQTIYHLPDDDGAAGFARSTLQIGEPAVIAARTGVTCVADFRVADIAAGGFGAPLVSYADYLLLRDKREDRVALNIGGIANLTLLPANTGVDGIRASDIGPGNMLIDQAVAHLTGGRERFDQDGAIAAKAQVCRPLLDWLKSHPYFARSWPKTTGREMFGEEYFGNVVEAARGFGASVEEMIATLTTSTAETIADAVPSSTRRVIVSGGGASNGTLVARLRTALATRFQAPPIVSRSDEFGMPADAKEAMSFALLAHRTMVGLPGNVPGATGARRPAVLGKIAPGDNFLELIRQLSGPI